MTVISAEKEIIEQLYRLHYKKLFIYARAILKNPDQAEDVVQDTFHEAMRHAHELSTHENPGGWLMNTLKNKIRESERARLRFINHCLSLDTDISDDSTCPDKLIVEDSYPGETASSILKKVEETLTPDEFYLLKRLVFDRIGHLKLAQELGITVYASEKRLERIRNKLQPIFFFFRKKK